MKNSTQLNSEIKKALLFTLHPAGALPVIRSFNWAGIKCFTISHTPIGIHRFSRYNKKAFNASKDELQIGNKHFFKKVNEFIVKNKIDVITGTDTDTTRMVIKNRQQWKGVDLFPTPDLLLFEKLQDKWSFSVYVKQCSLPQPESKLIAAADELDQSKLSFPILLKPREGAGGVGIIKIDNYSSLNKTLEKLRVEGKLPIVAQEYIEGEDIDYNFIAKDGKVLQWGIQQRISSQKGLIRFLLHDEVSSICSELIQRCKYTGIGHIDLRIDRRDGRVKLIEINPRFWGSIEYSTAMGSNFPYLGILLMINKIITPSVPPTGDCPYLPISFSAAIRKAIGKNTHVNNPKLERYQKYLWSDPAPELIDESRRRLKNFFNAG